MGEQISKSIGAFAKKLKFLHALRLLFIMLTASPIALFLQRLTLLIFGISLFSAQAQFPLNGSSAQSKASLITNAKTVTAGSSFTVYLKLVHPEQWHSYYLNNAVPLNVIPTIQWEEIEGVKFGEIRYPVPEAYKQYDVTSYIYAKEVTLPVQIKIAENAKLDSELMLNASADWQICKESCLSESAELSLSIPVSDQKILHSDEPNSLQTGTIPSYDHSYAISASLSATELIFTLPDSAPNDLFFYDFDGITNLESKQTYTGGQLTISRDKGNLFRDDPRQPKQNVRGIIVSDSTKLTTQGDHAIWIDIPLAIITTPNVTQDVLAKQNPSKEAESIQALSFDPALLASLYQPDTPIAYETLKKSVKTTFWVALGGAFIGGLLLNLMPCVFPVLSLKVMGFVEQAGQDPWKIRLHGLIFTLGVMVSMWVLAGALLFLKLSAEESVNWGQQMGDPRFVAGIIIVLFLFGLNMAGVFELGTKLTSVGGNRSESGYLGSFVSGILTTVIATPCSGPFLGAAMGYTLDQSVPVALVIFTIFALGIALPYLLLSFFPKLTSFLPRPGAWMETLKKLLSFGMFAAAAFFLRTFGGQTGWEGTTTLIMALVVLGLGAYTYGHWTLPHLKKSVRYGLGFGLSLCILFAGLRLSWNAATQYETAKEVSPPVKTTSGSIEWIPWQPGIVEQLRADGHYVWVDYTAQWCATCLYNKSRIFKNDEVLAAFAALDVKLVKADMTENSPVLAKDLSRIDRVQIPVNLVYSPDQDRPAILLEELISPKDAMKALDRVK